MPSIIVSGSNGFIGQHLIAKLSKNKKSELRKINKSFGNISA